MMPAAEFGTPLPSVPRTDRERKLTRKPTAFWALLAILLLAAVLRAATIAFGLPALNDQDELMFELGAIKMLRGHTLNPGWFGHPATTTMYVLALTDIVVYLTGLASGWWSGAKAFTDAVYVNPGLVILPGRVAIMAFGLLTIALTHRLAKRLFGEATGLVAALLLALDPLHLAYSQIVRADMMACAFMLLAMLAALRVYDEGRRRDFVIGGLWTGIAIASKWPFALSLLATVAAGLRRQAERRARPGKIVKGLATSVLATVAALLAASPFLVLDWHQVVFNLRGEGQRHHLGATGGSALWNAGWYLSHPLLNAFGLAGLLLAACGCVIIARDRRAATVILSVAFAVTAVFVMQDLVWARWALPLLPLLSIAAAAATVCLTEHSARCFGPRARPIVLILLGCLVLPPLALTIRAESRERMNDTRQQATAWLAAHVPPGKNVLIEHFGFDLLRYPYSYLWPVGTAGCIEAHRFLAGKVSYQTVEKLRQGRTNIDYGTVAPGTIASCRADYAILSQYDRYAAERTDFPGEYANYQALLAHARPLAVFKPRPGESGGWIVRIVAFDQPATSGPAKAAIR